MRSRLLVRGRALTGCACAALAAGVAGCGTTSSTPSVTGATLTIYASQPPGGAGGQEAQDLLAAERLALRQAGTTVGKFTIKFVPLQGAKLSDNARQAIGDSSTIAYLGELLPGASEDTIGITNAQDVLEVSPTDTAVEETQRTGAVPNSPTRYYESLSTYQRTFARVAPTDALEAKALIAEMQALGRTKLYVVGDGSPYAKALARAVTSQASPAITAVSAPASADAVLYAGSSASAAARLFDGAAANNPAVKLFASSALARDAFAASLSPAAQRDVYVSSPGFSASDLPAQGKQFVSAFRAAYGHAPATEAIFGYEAMAAVMAVLHTAGSGAGNRTTVVHGFFAIKNRSSALGTYSINQNGDTSIAPFVFSRVRSGKLVPYKAVQEQG
jgi:branched-chain amino acid transport system substrate-binding protein